jgi:hypothetical protein
LTSAGCGDDPDQGVSRAELIKIGRPITVANNVNAASTWFDAMK